MASATTTSNFQFLHLHSSTLHQTLYKPKSPLFSFHSLPSKHPLFSSPFKPPATQFIPSSSSSSSSSSSIDITEDNKATSKDPSSPAPAPEPATSEPDKFDPRRLEEKFAVLNTGIYECRSCGYRYDETAGDPSYPVPPGLEFGKLPEDWRCPTCGAAKSFFESKSVEIAGFAENQQFGLGGNALTSSQKALLIYGSLFFFFVLFLSGYFLQ